MAIRRLIETLRCSASEKIEGVVVERRQRANHADHHRHRVRITTEPGIELGHLVMHHRVILDGVLERPLLDSVRQLAVLEQIGDFEEVALLGKLLDGVAAIQQLALVTVDEGDPGLAARRR